MGFFVPEGSERHEKLNINVKEVYEAVE